jgi:ubiquinone/menaquinone biosynthesis C-methylase UbiE
LVEKIASQLGRPVIATDFSPSVLRRDRKYFQFLELDNLVSFLAFDARKTPFKNGSIDFMTTNLGLPNIEHPGDLLSELLRIISGTLLAISNFYPQEDDLNRNAITQAGIEAFVYKDSAMQYFSATGWSAKVENSCVSSALPTPASDIFDGARADGLPVAPTILEWCTIRAKSNMVR